MAIKLDMSKAYGRIEWSFIEEIMTRMGFDFSWVNAIMKCVSSVAYSVVINGHRGDKFVPTRVLRQGDPLSPFLFLICGEGLSSKPVTENEAREFLKFLKHSDYSVVEQLHKQPARISVLELPLSSETHRNALIKVLNETYVANDISVNKLDHLVNNINAEKFIFFNDDEILLGGMGSTKALHITTRCKGYILPGVLIERDPLINSLQN